MPNGTGNGEVGFLEGMGYKALWLRDSAVADGGWSARGLRGRLRDMNESSAHRSAGPPDPTVWPSVGFNDVGAGIDCLTRTLGFTVTAQYRGADRTLEHAEARCLDGVGVMFGSRGKAGA